MIAVLIDFRVGNECVGDEVEIFELPDDECGFAVHRKHQRLEGVIARRLLPGEIVDILGAGHDHDVDSDRGKTFARACHPLVVFHFRECRLRALPNAAIIHI